MVATTTQPNPAPAASTSSFKSFADYVDYPTMFAELRSHGIELTDEEKARCQQICGDRLRNHDGGQVVGNSIGGFVQGLVVTLVTFMKNLLSGNFSGIGDMFSHFGSTVTGSGEQSKLWQLQQAERETYERLQQAGGNLAAAAEYITGVKPSDDNSPGKILNASILNQVGRSINLPVDTDTSLNANTAFVASATPPRAPTQALTARR